MRNRFRLLLVSCLLILASACTATTGAGGTTPVAPVPATSGPTPSFLQFVRLDLAQEMGLSPDEIELRSVELVRWNDACLQVSEPGELCAHLITPGYRVVFSTPDGDVEVHTDRTGQVYRRVASTTSPPPTDGQTAIIWERSGGFAAVCQQLVIDTGGEYVLEDSCRPDPASGGVIPEESRIRLHAWLGEYRAFTWESVPPADSADMFSARLTFNGTGDKTASSSEQGRIAELLSRLSTELEENGQATPDSSSGIEGRVVIGPSCPVARAESPCPDRPLQIVVTVLGTHGQVVTRLQSGADGTFRVALPPGDYVLEGEAQGFRQVPVSVEVTVEGGRYSQVTLAYDSGIR